MDRPDEYSVATADRAYAIAHGRARRSADAGPTRKQAAGSNYAFSETGFDINAIRVDNFSGQYLHVQAGITSRIVPPYTYAVRINLYGSGTVVISPDVTEFLFGVTQPAAVVGESYAVTGFAERWPIETDGIALPGLSGSAGSVAAFVSQAATAGNNQSFTVARAMELSSFEAVVVASGAVGGRRYRLAIADSAGREIWGVFNAAGQAAGQTIRYMYGQGMVREAGTTSTGTPTITEIIAPLPDDLMLMPGDVVTHTDSNGVSAADTQAIVARGRNL